MNRRTRLGLLTIMALYLVLAGAFSVIVPLGEAPDELDHYLYVRYLAEKRAFPVMKPAADENETMEANQPPLFYLLNAMINAPFPLESPADLPRNTCYTFIPNEGRAHFYLHSRAEQSPFTGDLRAFHYSRLFSVMMGAATVWLTFMLARQMAPARPSVWLLAAGLLAFNPQFLFISASVNNDVLTAVMGAALLYFSARSTVRPSLPQFIGLGVLMGLALLTKFALLALWPLLFLAALLVGWKGQGRLAIRGGLVMVVLPLSISGWWYARAFNLYGDPLAWQVHLQAKGSEVLRTLPLTAADLVAFGRIHFQSYWAWFGWLKLQAPGWVYVVLALIVSIAIVGLAFMLGTWLKDKKQRFTGDLGQMAVLFNLLAIGAIYFSLFRYIQTINWSGYQGRLAYAVAAPIAALLALGLGEWQRWLENKQWLTTSTTPAFTDIGPPDSGLTLHNFRLPFIFLTGFFLLSAASLLLIIRPAYARPDIYTPDAALPRNCIEVAGLLVEAVDVTDVLPGQGLFVQLFAYGLEKGEDVPLQFEVLGRDDRLVSSQTGSYSWEPGGLLNPQIVLPIPEDVEPVRATVRFGRPVEMKDLTTAVIRPAQTFVAQPEHPIFNGDFEGMMTLTGFDLDTDRVTLYWQATADMETDYTTFIHVLDDDGNLISQADGQPQNGFYPTSVWRQGEQVADPKALSMPDSRPYYLVAGVYRLESGERLLLAGSGLTVVELPTVFNE